MSALAIDFAVPVLGDNAGSSSWKALSRDLYGDTGAAILPVVGKDVSDVWDSYPIAGMDPKLSHGSEQSSDESARCAAGIVAASGGSESGFSSLDSIKNNRHTEPYERRPENRGTFCGRWCMRGINPATGRMCTRRLNCKSWACSYCGPRRARTARAAIKTYAEGLGLKYFLTLTLDPSKLDFIQDKSFAVPYMRQIWSKFREYLRRAFGCAPSFIVVLEFTQAGWPHFHVLLDRYVDQSWISKSWENLGGGRICHIEVVKLRSVSRYLSKYLTKDLFLSAPKGSRRITSSRTIKLFPPWVTQRTAQEIITQSVWGLLSEQRMTRAFTEAAPMLNIGNVLLLEYDEEKFLENFEVIHEDLWN